MSKLTWGTCTSCGCTKYDYPPFCSADCATNYIRRHAETERQLADARARIAELEESLDIAVRATVKWSEGHDQATARAIAAEEREARLRGVLREVEWSGRAFDTRDEYRGWDACPCCDVERGDDHAPDCKLHSALADAGAGNQDEGSDEL